MNDNETKTASVFMQDSALLNAVKAAFQKMGIRVSHNLETIGESDFVLFDAYFLQLGVGNVLKKENPAIPLILVAKEKDFKSKELRPRIDFYDTVRVDDHDSEKMRRQITAWFLTNGGRSLIREPNKIRFAASIKCGSPPLQKPGGGSEATYIKVKGLFRGGRRGGL